MTQLMKMKTVSIALILLSFSFSSFSQIYDLKSEYDPDLNEICSRYANNQWGMEFDKAKKNLADIYQILNLSGYNIDIIECTAIKSSALAWMEPKTLKRFILINPDKAQNINTHYYSHLFVIAHEFGHHRLNHFGVEKILTLEDKRNMELEADRFGASLVRKDGGTLSDCYFALNVMRHPENDTYYDHPTLEKRLKAVREGFYQDTYINTETTHSYTNFFSDYSDVSLLSYDSEVNPVDINTYSRTTGLIPRTISYFNNKYWIYWKKDDNVSNWQVFWNYDYDASLVQKYFNMGYNLNFIEQINNKWFMVFCKLNTGQFKQSLNVVGTQDFISLNQNYSDKIESRLKEGYLVQNIVPYDKSGNIMVVLSKKINEAVDWTWAFKNTYEDISAWIKTQAGNGYNYLYTYKIVNGQYFGFMTKLNTVKTWTVESFDGTNINPVKTLLNNGYLVGNLTYDPFGLRFTMVRFSN